MFDPALVQAARQGDRAALDALLRAARPYIRRHAGRRCATYADDATQETLRIVHEKLPSLRSAAAFPGWLIRIVARICFGVIAPIWRRIEVLKADDLADEADAVSVEVRLDLARAVDRLPNSHRRAILLHYFDGLSVAEVAAELGISESATKVRMHRGREQLRVRLGAEFAGD